MQTGHPGTETAITNAKICGITSTAAMRIKICQFAAEIACQAPINADENLQVAVGRPAGSCPP
jgi:hypothetical protein